MKRFVLVLAFAVSLLPGALFSQGGVKVKITATGTGNTTGHIANLTVNNMEKNNIRINTQTAYIPSDGRYQSYVGTVPETTVPPGTTIIPVNGNCANVSSPPFPIGIDMTVEKWIPVGTIGQPLPEGTINILPMPTKPQFTPDDIPDLIGSSGYTLITDLPKGDSEIIINWPDSNIPVGGVIDPDKYPEDFAPVIVEVLADIIDAVDIILKDDQYGTPFSGNPEKERESVIQQTFWIYMAAATGDEYEQDDFEGKVYDQFLTSSGKPVASLPEEQKKEIDDGIGDFWNTFVATGVEAKVLRVPDKTTSANTVPVQESPDDSEEYEKPEDRKCICDTISMNLVIRHIHEGKIVTDVDEPVTLTKETDELKRTIQNVDNDEKLTFTLSDVQAKCSCSYGEVDCQDYGSRNESGKLGNSDEVKIRTDNAKNCVVEEKPDEFAGTSFSFVIKSKSKKKDDKDGVSIDIIVTAHCKSDECNMHRSDKCEKTITIRLTKPAN